MNLYLTLNGLQNAKPATCTFHFYIIQYTNLLSQLSHQFTILHVFGHLYPVRFPSHIIYL